MADATVALPGCIRFSRSIAAQGPANSSMAEGAWIFLILSPVGFLH